MLKLFYKTLLVSVLSGSLLMLDFSFKGAWLNVNVNSVQAETVKTQGIGDGDLMATLTMTSVGLIASRLFTYKMTTDVMIAAAGGAAFIAGEILATFKLKSVIKDMEVEITRDDKGNIDQKQIETLERLKESYQKAMDTANTKKTLQQAAAAAFAAAAIAAIVLKSSETLAFEGCQTVITSAGSACPMSAGTAAASTGALKSLQLGREAGGPSMTSKAAETTALTTFTTSQATLTTSLTTSAASYSAICANPEGGEWACPYVGACTSASASLQACTSVGPTCQMTGAYGVFGVIGYEPIKSMMPAPMYSAIPQSENIFSNIAKVFMSEARADLFSPLGIASGLAIKYLVATNTALSAQIDAFLFTPMKRAMAWAVLSGLTFAASSATDNQIQKIKANISKIDQILNSMYALQKGVASANASTVKNPTVEKTIVQNGNLALNGSTGADIDLKANGGTSLPCMTGSSPDKCPSYSEKINAQTDLKSMPDFVQTQIKSIAKLTDGINGTSKISGATLAQAQALAGQHNTLKAILAKQQKALQEKLKASGSKFDIAKEGAKLEADMKAAVQKELNKNQTSAGDVLASFGGANSHFGSSNAIATDANKLPADKAKGAKSKNAFGGTVVALPAATASFDSKMGKDIDMEAARLAAEKKAADEAAAANGASATATASIDDYDLKNDITQDKDSSIFDLISNRYQKSYDRLFKRIK